MTCQVQNWVIHRTGCRPNVADDGLPTQLAANFYAQWDEQPVLNMDHVPGGEVLGEIVALRVSPDGRDLLADVANIAPHVAARINARGFRGWSIGCRRTGESDVYGRLLELKTLSHVSLLSYGAPTCPDLPWPTILFQDRRPVPASVEFSAGFDPAAHPRGHGGLFAPKGHGSEVTPPAADHSQAGLLGRVTGRGVKAPWSAVLDRAKAVHVAVWSKLVLATPRVLALLPDILDVPDDLNRLGAAPAMAGVTGAIQDPTRDALGISTHAAAAIASHVLARAAVHLKHKLAGRRDMADGDPAAELADLLAELLPVAFEAAGVKGWKADRAAVERHVRARLGQTFAAWKAEDHPRGQPGNKGQFGPGGGGAEKTDDDERTDPRGKDRPTGSSRRSKAAARRPRSKAHAAAGGLRDVSRRRRVIAAVKREAELADAIGGYNLPDSEPADVVRVGGDEAVEFKEPWQVRQYLAKRARLVKRLTDLRGGKVQPGRFESPDEADKLEKFLTVDHPLHLFEVKTLLTSPDSAVHMSKKALRRKEQWANRFAGMFHVVAFDDRRGAKHSGHRVHVAPGTLGGTLRLRHMAKAADPAEVLAHITGPVPVAG